MSKEVILSGLRANNDLHIGNYLGALLPMVDMAKNRSSDYQINLFIPDLHSFTTPIDHSSLQQQVLNNVKLYAAAGLPIESDSIFVYRQSYIPAHSELTWILSCFTSLGQMSRMTQFKIKAGIQELDMREHDLYDELKPLMIHLMNITDFPQDESGDPIPVLTLEKLEQVDRDLRIPSITHELLQIYVEKEKRSESLGLGLLNYPVLMAADILLYDAKYIPVGDDQAQHIEFTRDLAMRINNKFGDLFDIPLSVSEQHEFFGKDQGLRIRNLLDPTKKMSKSDDNDRGVIFLRDDPETSKQKIMGAATDSVGTVNYDYTNQPGISNLLDMLKLLGGDTDSFIGQNQYGPLKAAVADKIAGFLTDFQAKLQTVDEAAVLSKLETSEAAMNETANQTLLKVQKAVGLRPQK